MHTPPSPATPTDAPATTTVAPPGGRGRIGGVDLARGLAIVGMMMVHLAPPLAGTGGWYGLPYGRASAVFALVAGIGITLAGRRSTVGEQRSRLLWRTAWLLPVGLALQSLDHPVAVILQYYAVWFALCVPVVQLRTRTIALLAAVVTLLGGTVLVWAQVTHPAWYAPGRGVLAGTFGDLLLTGYYPTVSWLGLVYAGIALGRLDLGRPRAGWLLTAGGAAASGAAHTLSRRLDATVDLGRWQPWLDTTGHADTPLEMVASGGIAVAVVGVCLLVATVAGPLAAPGVAFGRFALTTYVGHILLYAAFRSSLAQTTPVGGLVATGVLTALFTVVAVVWLALLPRGPLEWLDRAGHDHLVRPALDAVGRALRPTDGAPRDGGGTT